MIGFPRVPEVEFFLGSWQSVSADIRQGSTINVTTGRKDWAAKTSPARLTFTLDDGPEHGDGDYDPDNPNGQWFGTFGRNTPARYALRYGRDTFTRANQASWGTSPDMGTWGTFTSSGSATANITSNQARHSLNGTTMFVATYLPTVAQRNVEVYNEFTLGALTVAGGAIEPSNLMLRGHSGGDYWLLRVSVNTANQVSLQIMLTGTAIGSPGAGPVAVLTYPTGGTDLGVRFQAEGDTLRGKVWRLDLGEPRDWHIETTVENETLGSGWVGVRSGVAGGNSNSKPLIVTSKRFDVRLPEFIGETAKVVPKSSVDHREWRTEVECASIRRRLALGARVLDTALRRYILRAEAPFGIADYWPLDQDGASATRAANILGGPDAAFVRGPVSGLGALEYGFNTTFLSAPKAAQLSTDGRISMSMTPGNFVTTDGFGNTWLQKIGAGCKAFVAVNLDNGAQLLLQFDAGTVVFTMSDAIAPFIHPIMTVNIPEVGTDTSWHMIGIGTRTSGANVLYGLAIDDTLVESTVAGSTGRPTAHLVFADDADNSTLQLSQVVTMRRYLFNFPPGGDFPYNTIRNIYLGRPTEHAGTRFVRLCTEESVSRMLVGTAAGTPAMGPQRPLTFMQLVQECIDVDQGSAFDPVGAAALGMRTHRATTANDPALTADYIGQVAAEFAPTTDDQPAANDWTAKRPNGGEYRVQQITGPMNVADPGSNADAVGRYDKTVSPPPNVPSDLNLINQASWRVHMGTVDAPRFPTLRLDLSAEAVVADPAMVAAALDVRIDDAVTVTGASVRRTYDDVRLIVRGKTSSVDTQYRHTLSFNCEPYAPMDVAVFGDTDDRWGEGVTVLAGTLTTVATSFSVSIVSGQPWTTAAAQFPIDFMIEGQRVRVSSISGTGPQTFTVAPGGLSINGVLRQHLAGAAVHLFKPVYFGH